MTYKTIMRPIAVRLQTLNDKTILAPYMHSKQSCNECNVAIEPIFKDDHRKADTWFWRECDSCENPVCENCSTQDDEGHVECITCRTARRAK